VREGFYASVLERVRAEDPAGPRLRAGDLRAGLASFLLVFGATFPAVVPFFFLSDKFVALRASNAVLLLSLFAMGWRWGAWIGAPRFLTGAAMTAIGFVLVVAAIALGG
jgi:VIT1/CCC1 family predicted Fe2+/Mn2+ transporter